MDPFERKIISEIKSISNDICRRMAEDMEYGHCLGKRNRKNFYGPLESPEAFELVNQIAMKSVEAERVKNPSFDPFAQ